VETWGKALYSASVSINTSSALESENEESGVSDLACLMGLNLLCLTSPAIDYSLAYLACLVHLALKSLPSGLEPMPDIIIRTTSIMHYEYTPPKMTPSDMIAYLSHIP